MEPITDDLSSWMSNLPENIRERPLTQLAIPGPVYLYLSTNLCVYLHYLFVNYMFKNFI